MLARSLHFSLAADRIVPRELQAGDCAGSLPVVGFLSGIDTSVLQFGGTISAALLSAVGLTRIKLGFWCVLNPLISSDTLEVRGRGVNPKHSCFLVSSD